MFALVDPCPPGFPQEAGDVPLNPPRSEGEEEGGEDGVDVEQGG